MSMEQIASLFGNYQLPTKTSAAPAKAKKGTSERGELLKYFAQKIGKPVGFVAMKCTGLQLQDLYYLKSTCDSEEKRGVPWSKVFYGSLKPRI
jgi:hypothetical protein